MDSSGKSAAMNECPATRVYLLGDSITQGLGSKRINFTESLSVLLGSGYEIDNLALTGTMIDYANELITQRKIRAGEGSICVIAYGNVDAQVRPSRTGKIYPHIPKRFRGGGMLMPRPFYSRAPMKRLVQHMENFGRRCCASLIVAVDGTEQWMPIAEFSSNYRIVLRRLTSLGMRPILCSCVYIDERLFPGSSEQYLLYNKEIAALAKELNLPFADFYRAFETAVTQFGWDAVYNKDHFHPNGSGYQLIAGMLAQIIRSMEGGACTDNGCVRNEVCDQ